MQGTKFRTAPDIIKYKIPFELEEQALTEWLSLLSLEQSYFSCKELFCVLQTFTRMVINPEQHLVFLKKISTNLDDLATLLENKYLYESFPLDNEAQACIDIVTFSYAMLAENYSTLGNKFHVRNDVKNEQLAFYLALRSAGRALLCMAQGYMQPYEGFWLFCHHVYAFAEQHKLLNQEASTEETMGATIDAVFKQILLFDRIDTNQFSPQEMKITYAVLQQFSGDAVISKKYARESVKGLFLFNLNEDKRIRELVEMAPYKDPADRYFSPFPVAKSLYRFLQLKASLKNNLISENRNLCFRIIQSLSAPQKRKYSRIIEQRHGLGIIGFDNISKFLRRKGISKKNNVISNQKTEIRIAGNWRAPDLNYPEGDEWLEQMMDDKSFTDALTSGNTLLADCKSASGAGRERFFSEDNAVGGGKIPIGEFEIINSSAQGLHASWQAVDLKVKVGDIFAIPSDKDDQVHIGLIRRINRPTHENVRLSIELIGFKCELVQLIRQGHPDLICEAILLPGIKSLKQQDSIIFSTGNFIFNENCRIRRENMDIDCRIQGVLNSTSSICQRELSYVAE